MINVQGEQQWTKNSPWWDRRQNWSPLRSFTINNNSLFSISKNKERNLYIWESSPTPTPKSHNQTICFSVVHEGCVQKAFSKSDIKCVHLSPFVQDFYPIINSRAQLSFTTMSFPKCMLSVWQKCCLSNKSLCSSKCVLMFVQIICSSTLHGTQVRDTGR